MIRCARSRPGWPVAKLDPESLGRTAEHHLQGEPQQALLGGEVVAQGPHRPAGLGGHRAYGRTLDAGSGDHGPDRPSEFLPTLIMVDDLRHDPL